MASKVVFVQPDPFKGQGKRVASYIPDYASLGEDSEALKLSNAEAAGYDTQPLETASRPVNGIAIKPNTHAFVQVINADGKILKVFNQLGSQTPVMDPETHDVNPNSIKGDAWTDWILQGVREERMEKTQVVETFGETYLYAFGERPRSLVFSGLLMNTLDYNWRAIFWENWDKYFRATKLVENNARIYIGFDDILVEGYPMNAVASQTADSPNALSFSFNFFVTNYTNLAAQRDFKHQNANSLAVVRSGYQRGAEGLRKSDRISLAELFGFKDVSNQGNLIYKQMIEAGYTQQQALLAGKTVNSFANAAQKAAFTSISSPANALAFTEAFLNKTTLDVFRATAATSSAALEKKLNLKKGEVNAWFGLMGTILDGVDNSSALSALDLNSAGFQLLKLGSIDRIVQAMAYNVGAVLAPKGTQSTEAENLASLLFKPKPGGMTTVPSGS
jgi:hypothetical protein